MGIVEEMTAFTSSFHTPTRNNAVNLVSLSAKAKWYIHCHTVFCFELQMMCSGIKLGHNSRELDLYLLNNKRSGDLFSSLFKQLPIQGHTG